MVKNVGLIRQKGLVPQGSFHCGDALLVLFERKIGQTLLVEELRVTAVDL